MLALKWVEAIVDVHSTEAGFLAVVDERVRQVDVIDKNKKIIGQEDQNYYFVRDIFYPKHYEANGGTCEIDEGHHAEWLFNNDKDDDVPKIKFWGHSHVNMGTGASGQDENQAIERMTGTQSYLLRAIANKRGDLSISFFDYERMLRFDNVQWEAFNDLETDIDSARAEIISLILSNDALSATDKIVRIGKVTKEDPELEQIKLHISRLKETHIPKTPVITHHKGGMYPNKSSVSQQKMFSHEKGFRNPKSIEFPSRLNPGETDQIINEWEEMQTSLTGSKKT